MLTRGPATPIQSPDPGPCRWEKRQQELSVKAECVLPVSGDQPCVPWEGPALCSLKLTGFWATCGQKVSG